MRELLELRVREAQAYRVFRDDEGVPSGFGIRKITISSDDPRLPQIAELQRELRKQDEHLFFGWNYTRRYTKAEVQEARAFLVAEIPTFEPAGEENGTEYSDEMACPICHSRRDQVSPLRLPTNRIPKRVHLARTIAGELTISKVLFEASQAAGICGLRSAPIEGPDRKASPGSWMQLCAEPAVLELAPTTRAGNAPFDPDVAGQYRCPLGCTAGLNLLSELSLLEPGLADSDVGFTRVRIGVRRGLLNPSPLMVVSPRFYRLLQEGFGRRLAFEVAKIVPSAA